MASKPKEATKRSAPTSSPQRRTPTKKPTKAPRRQQPAKRPTEPPEEREPLSLNADQAAGMLGISKRTLWSITRAGEVPHVRIRNRIIYPRRELEEWLSRRAAQSVRKRRDS